MIDVYEGPGPALSQSGEIFPDFCCFYGSGIRHNEDIMHSFQNFIVRLIPKHPHPLETRIWKLVVRALTRTKYNSDLSEIIPLAGLRMIRLFSDQSPGLG